MRRGDALMIREAESILWPDSAAIPRFYRQGSIGIVERPGLAKADFAHLSATGVGAILSLRRAAHSQALIGPTRAGSSKTDLSNRKPRPRASRSDNGQVTSTSEPTSHRHVAAESSFVLNPYVGELLRRVHSWLRT